MASSHIRSVQWQRQNCPSRLARRFPPNDDMMAPPKVSLAVRNRVKFALVRPSSVWEVVELGSDLFLVLDRLSISWKTEVNSQFKVSSTSPSLLSSSLLSLCMLISKPLFSFPDYISDLGLHLISLSDAKETVASMQEQLREMRAKLASLEREKESGSSIPLSLSPRLPLVLLSRIRDSIED